MNDATAHGGGPGERDGAIVRGRGGGGALSSGSGSGSGSGGGRDSGGAGDSGGHGSAGGPGSGDQQPPDVGEFDGDEFEDGRLEEELRQAAAILDPVPVEVRRVAIEAYALVDLDAKLAELTFDSLTHGIPVRGAADPPRMLTFDTGELTVDVEVTSEGLLGQLMPPQPARIEVLNGPQAGTPLTADDLGRFSAEAPPSGPFALRVRTGEGVVVTEWLRA